MFNLLSVELIELIARALDDRVDLLTLRCACRYLYRATSAVFATAWFATLTIDFTPRCLHRLANITQNDDLVRAVRCFRIANCYKPPIVRPVGSHDQLARVLGEGLSWPRLEDGCLDVTSQSVDNFTTLLARFSLCRDICVTDELDESHWDGDTNTRLSPVDACYILFSLLERYKKFHIQSFDIKVDGAISFLDEPVELPPRLADPLARTSWPSHLRSLSITWKLSHRRVSATMDLISTATHAQSMKLSFLNCSEVVFRLLGQAPQLPALTELTLSDARWLTPEALFGVIVRFRKSLKSLHINRVPLSSGDYNTLFGLLANENMPALESIAVSDCFGVFFCPLRLKPDVLERCGGRFEFILKHSERNERVSGVRYRGSGDGMQLALQTLADKSSYQVGPGWPSPGLINMQKYTGNMVGHVVDEFI